MTRFRFHWFKINPGFAVDLNNYAAKSLPRLFDLRLAAIPCDNDVWACPTFGRVGLYHAAKEAA